MPKTITSPVDKWPGTVVLSDPLTFPQSFAFKDGLKLAREYIDKQVKSEGEIDHQMANYLILPGVFECVEAWELGGGFPENPTLDTFPASPNKASDELVAWLIDEVSSLYSEGEEIPNE